MEEQRGAGPVAQTERADPREGGVDPQRERAPLRQIAGHAHEHDADRGDRAGDCEIARDRARARSLAHEVPEREGGQHGAELAQEGAKRVRIGGRGEAVGPAAHRLAQRAHPDREQQPREADEEVGGLPALEAEGRGARREGCVPAVDDLSADHQPETAAEVDAARVDGEHRRAAARGKRIGEHREGRRRGAGFADPDADARQRQRAEAARETG